MLGMAANILSESWRSLSSEKDAFGSIESLAAALESCATILGILVAGVWTYRLFVKNREEFPKASLTQVVSFWNSDDGNRLIRVSMTIKNEGNVLVKIPSGFTWIQQMKPWPDELLKAKPVTQEIAWPLIESRDLDSGWEIEPKETEIISMDFVINQAFAQILVYSFIKNPKKETTGWPVTTIIDFEAEERKQEHTVMSDQHGIPGKRQGFPKERPQPTEQPPRRVHEQGHPKERPQPTHQPVKKGSNNA
jgi:hypothetical protein